MSETFRDALIECVKAAGGSKVVGATLWPSLEPDRAQRRLLDSLDAARRETLSPEHVLHVLRLARARGCHAGFEYMAADLGYAPPVPVEPKDEAAELQRQFRETVEVQRRLVERLERLQPQAGPKMRAA